MGKEQVSESKTDGQTGGRGRVDDKAFKTIRERQGRRQTGEDHGYRTEET